MPPGRDAARASLRAAILVLSAAAHAAGPQIPPSGGTPNAGTPEAPPDDAQVCATLVEEATALLKDDLYEDALDRSGSAVARCGESAAAHVAMADALYRRGDFDEAERHYRRGVAIDDTHARAHYGVGRILRTMGRYGEAAASFQKAAALAPDVPRFVRTLANHLARREDVIGTLRRYLAMAKDHPDEDAATVGNVEAWIALLEKAGDAPLSHMERSDPTTLKMRVSKSQPYIRIGVNDQDDRRFVFDTGATGMTISPRLARKASLEPIRPYTIAGTGAGRLETGTLALIDTIRVGEGIVIRNVPATVRDPAGPEEGLIGPSIFARMRITIDMKGGSLSFSTPGAGSTAPDGGRVEPFRNVGGEILLPARVNGTPFNAMLDTGSASTIIGNTTVARLPDLQALPGQWFAGTTVGVGGPLGERRVILKGTLEVAGRSFPADGLLSGDLGGLSRALESEVYLILGVPHLDAFVLILDYAAMTVTFVDRS